MSDKQKVALILSTLFLILAGFFAFDYLKDYMHQNPEELAGNTAGNLNNGGYFCQLGDTVYFSNAYDSGKLYAMNADETNVRRISKSRVSYINADDKYLYYYMNDDQAETGLGFTMRINGLYRCNLNGKKEDCLEKVPCGMVKLLGNHLFYQRYDGDKKESTLYVMDIQKHKREQVLEIFANPAASYGNRLYYNGLDGEHYLYSYDPAAKTSSVVFEGNVWNPDVQGEYTYFMNISDDYKICRYNMASGEVQTLTAERTDGYLIAGGRIFYQTNSEDSPALMVMELDGSDPQVVKEGVHNNMNATSRYLYFSEFGNETPVYKVPLDGGALTVGTFDAAKDAAVAQMQKK